MCLFLNRSDDPVDAREVLRAKAKEQREKLLKGLQQREKQDNVLPASAIAAAAAGKGISRSL